MPEWISNSYESGRGRTVSSGFWMREGISGWGDTDIGTMDLKPTREADLAEWISWDDGRIGRTEALDVRGDARRCCGLPDVFPPAAVLPRKGSSIFSGSVQGEGFEMKEGVYQRVGHV